MPSLLVHSSTGPESPTRASLAFLVARAALAAGVDVSVFLAGDAVSLVRVTIRDALTGVGTGSLAESFEALVSGGSRLYLSGASSAARGITSDDLDGISAEFATPARLVELTFAHDRVLTY